MKIPETYEEYLKTPKSELVHIIESHDLTISDAQTLLKFNKEKIKMNDMMNTIKAQLEEKGYDHAVAIATEAEIKAGAACGQLSLLTENQTKKKKA